MEDSAFVYNRHEIPAYQPPAYAYKSAVVHNYVAWVSGHVPKIGAFDFHPGKVGADVSLEQAKDAARLAVRNALASLSKEIGSLDKVEQVLKVTVFVASAAGFTLQPKVADAASQLLLDIFEQRGNHARTALGVSELPRNSCVEIEMVVAVRT